MVVLTAGKLEDVSKPAKRIEEVLRVAKVSVSVASMLAVVATSRLDRLAFGTNWPAEVNWDCVIVALIVAAALVELKREMLLKDSVFDR